ncbi:hypothetical protein M419DRAFT_103251 [Trichoderma reesei RUT C-30]|uniref:WSC domain-containing protein n=1 Tax=Hypocrea jecorina (strain ATCC 56765 / BCRC 32924 / NRRL 11460 / Rut C-30) TaxID=1344414 RepID=A0A024S0J8_HYPJR|nr:hypothetical protein M419DRAFT_103251 [Trichoderma reesei RUT C-30]
MLVFRTAALQQGYAIFLLLAFSTLISAITVDVCSSFNTAETPLNVSIYQTNGLCTHWCVDKNYAFAITQQNSCWCSNYYPDKASTVSIKECNVPCPAWPDEYCGGRGLYGYLALNEVAPSGTKTAPASTSTPTESTSDSTTFSTSTPPPSSTPTTTPTDGSGGSGSRSTGSTPSQTADPSKDESGGSAGGGSKKSGLGTGAIAGIAVGVVLGVLALAGALLFLFLRRRRQGKDEYQNDPSVRGSSSGMVGVIPGDLTGNSGSPASPVSVANRNSTIQIDPRMDPFKQGLYIRGSHESLNTLRDDHDYSRRIQPPKVLRAVNPDPEEP